MFGDNSMKDMIFSGIQTVGLAVAIFLQIFKALALARRPFGGRWPRGCRSFPGQVLYPAAPRVRGGAFPKYS